MRKKITYDELVHEKRFTSYSDEVNFVKNLIDTKKIIPIKNSETNGKKPALPMKYWWIEEEVDYGELLEEIKYRLSPDIHIEYYLKRPEAYKKEREYVLMLSDYLTHHKDRLDVQISMNERSYDIWKREKFLSKEQGRTVLSHCGIDKERLNFYETAEPLAYYSATKNTPQNMLMIENLDTFYSMRKHLINGNGSILGVTFGTVIYGGGKRIAKAFEDFEICAEPYMRAAGNVVYYFGDFDYEGIGIYESFIKRYSGKIKILPFCEAYLAMLEKADDIAVLPKTKEGQNRNIGQEFFSHFDEDTVTKMKNILAHDKYIPQETISILALRCHAEGMTES